jgi:hypothetical protein
MFYLMNSTDRSIVAEIKDYENIDDELKADQKRLRVSVGRRERAAYRLLDLVADTNSEDQVRLASYRVSPSMIERIS